MRAFSPRLLGHHQLQPKGAVPTARAQPCLEEGTALGAVLSNVLAASSTSARSMGLSAAGWADVLLPKREINQPLPGSAKAMMVNRRAKLREKKCIFPSNKYVLTVGLRENSDKHLFTL